MSEKYIIDDILERLDQLAERQEGSIDTAPELLHCFGVIYSFVCEIDNGGLAQFLWENVEHWEEMLSAASKAFDLVHAPDHVAAIKKFHTLCAVHAKSCQEAVERAEQTQDVKYFFDWYRDHEEALNTEDNDIFSFETGLGDLLESWAENNEKQLRKEMDSI